MCTCICMSPCVHIHECMPWNTHEEIGHQLVEADSLLQVWQPLIAFVGWAISDYQQNPIVSFKWLVCYQMCFWYSQSTAVYDNIKYKSNLSDSMFKKLLVLINKPNNLVFIPRTQKSEKSRLFPISCQWSPLEGPYTYKHINIRAHIVNVNQI